MTANINEVLDVLVLPSFIVQDGYFRWANRKVLEFTGLTPENLDQAPLVQFIHPDDHDMVLNNAASRQRGEEAPESYQFRAVGATGEESSIKGFFSCVQYNGRPATLVQIINVTGPEKLKEELNTQKVYFQQLFENSPQAIVILDNHDRVLNVNRGFEKLFQYSADEINGLPINRLIVPESLVEEASGLTKTVLGREPMAVETVRKCKDGTLVHVSALGCPIVLSDRQVGVFVIYTDITERRMASEKLKESEKKYRLVFENAPLGIFHFDKNGVITAVNDSFVSIIGSSREALIGLDILKLHDMRIVDQTKISLSGGQGRFEGYYRSITADKVTPVKVDFAPVVMDDGSPAGGVGIVEDITERRKAQEELFREKERLEVTLSSIGDAVIAVDNWRGITLINPVAQSLTGWSQEEATGRPLEEVFNIINEITRKPALNPVEKAMGDGKAVGLANHTVLISRDGTERSIMDTAAPICDTNGDILGVILVFKDITEEKKKEEALRKSEERFRNIVETTSDWIWEIDHKGKYTYVSPRIKDLLGYEPAEMIGRKPVDFMPSKEARRFAAAFGRQAKGRMPVKLEKTSLHREGHTVVFETRGVPFFDIEGNYRGYRGIDRDVTERRLAEQKLSAAHRQLQGIIEFLPDATFVIDKDGKVIAWNRAIEEMTGVPKEEMIGRGDYAYSVPFYGFRRPGLIDFIFSDSSEINKLYENIQRKGDTLFAETYVPFTPPRDGAYMWVKASPLYDRDGNVAGSIETIRDITDRKKLEEQLKYLILHDPLTGVYNRAYFEEEVRRLEGGRNVPIGIILCDVDGLKLVNDTMGHGKGDNLLIAAARACRESFRTGDMVARIGGDEFAILLPNTDSVNVEKACMRIRYNVRKYNEVNPDLPLSLSIGFSASADPSVKLSSLFKEADNNMYREKLHHSQSARSAIVHTLMKALEARDFITEGHADRIKDLVADMASAIGLPERNITDLRLLAQFHDIGKVGIPDRLLFKPGPLDEDEFNEMKRHSEIGYRIAKSSPDLVPIAEWILRHHEWWDGSGYPLGLKAGEIPLECRILSIADAYDAMTSDRPYRKAMTREQAVSELRRCAGLQFDPDLVELFIGLLEEKAWLINADTEGYCCQETGDRHPGHKKLPPGE